MAPHTAAQALKTAVYCAGVFESLGYGVNPKPHEKRYDIIQTVALGSPERLIAFAGAYRRVLRLTALHCRSRATWQAMPTR